MTSSSQCNKTFRQLSVDGLVQPEKHYEGDEGHKQQMEPEDIHLQLNNYCVSQGADELIN